MRQISETSFTLTTHMVDEFLTAQHNMGWSDLKLNRAKNRLAVFYADLSEDKSVTTETFQQWRMQLNERGLSERTVQEYLAVASQLIRYLGYSLFDMNKRVIDLRGMHFGDLIVLEMVEGKRSAERSMIWRCQCICGRCVEIPTNQLTKGHHMSCGCRKSEHLKEINQYVDGTSLRMIYSDTVRKDNTSGYKGIYQKNGRWAVRIQYKGKRYYLGAFEKLEDAVAVRKEAEEKIREECIEQYLNQ